MLGWIGRIHDNHQDQIIAGHASDINRAVYVTNLIQLIQVNGPSAEPIQFVLMVLMKQYVNLGLRVCPRHHFGGYVVGNAAGGG